MNKELHGFKVLFQKPDGYLYSPMFQYNCEPQGRWVNDTLKADKKPKKKNTNGIYAVKELDSKYLKPLLSNDEAVEVEVVLSGKVIEYTKGYRAQRADIVKILNKNGNW